MKISHDFVFALGSACTATDALRKSGLQYGSFPLDWVGFIGVPTYTNFICSDFEDFLAPERLKLESESGDGRHSRYVDCKYGTAFYHDFPTGKPLMESFPEVYAKYDRRIKRFMRHLRDSKDVLVVWIEDFRDESKGVDASDAAMIDCLNQLEKKFSGTHFSMLIFEQAPKGVLPREVPVGDGRIRRIALDYRDWDNGAESWAIHMEILAPYLSEHSVSDYRTAEEKRAYRCMLRQKGYTRLNAHSWLDMVVASIEYRMFRHLEKSLKRKGVSLS